MRISSLSKCNGKLLVRAGTRWEDSTNNLKSRYEEANWLYGAQKRAQRLALVNMVLQQRLVFWDMTPCTQAKIY
jgi:hypothetical protein